MANIQLPGLPSSTAGADTDLYHTRQGATDKTLTGELARQYFGGIIPWAASFNFIIGQTTVRNNKVYEAKTSNVNKDPDLDDGTDWLLKYTNFIDMKSGRKNFLINGNFDIWQRGTSFAITTAGDRFFADRWEVTATNKTNTQVRGEFNNTDIRRTQAQFFFDWDVTASSGAGDIRINNPIEGRPIGLLAGKTITVSFQLEVLSGLSTFEVALFQHYTNRGTAAEASTSTQTVTGTGKKELIFTLPSLLSGTTITDDATLVLELKPTDNNATFNIRLWNVQLEEGTEATDFDSRTIIEELSLCQRYYYKTFGQNITPAQNAGLTGAFSLTSAGAIANTAEGSLAFPITMRSAPSVITYNPSAANADWRNTNDNTDVSAGKTGNENGVTLSITGTPAAQRKHRIHITADAEL